MLAIILLQLLMNMMSVHTFIAPSTIEYQIYCILGGKYLPRPIASVNVSTLGATVEGAIMFDRIWDKRACHEEIYSEIQPVT